MTKTLLALLLIVPCPSLVEATSPEQERVVIVVEGWELVGDWKPSGSSSPSPAVLLLHRAAGSRVEYEVLSDLPKRSPVGTHPPPP